MAGFVEENSDPQAVVRLRVLFFRVAETPANKLAGKLGTSVLRSRNSMLLQHLAAACYPFNRQARAEQRRLVSRDSTASLSALREPTTTTSFRPRVRAVYSRFRCSSR